MRHSLLLLSSLVACAPAGVDRVGDTADSAVLDSASPACVVDADCDDGNPCTGTETCGVDGACADGEAVVCDDPGATCVVEGGEAVCAVLCALPVAPVLDVVRDDEVLTFAPSDGIEVAVLAEGEAVTEASWLARTSVSLEGRSGAVRVLARSGHAACDPDDPFDHTYRVVAAYPGAAGTPGASALAAADPGIVAWASRVVDTTFGADVAPAWTDGARALGAPGGNADVVSLGEGGTITLGFDRPIRDGDGPDLAVFENGFSDTFLEFSHVEVSSDGTTFVRFDAAAHTPDPVGAFGETDPTAVHGLGGTVRGGFGTPFDLAWLRFSEEVRAGQLDLGAVRYVRLVDVVGDGSSTDSWGRPIHDPFPTRETAGFDLDAVGVLHEAAP